MRWDGQRTDAEDQLSLPGLPGLVRSVRTPEFAGTVFHEIRAKSVLNRVHQASGMPFGWTVNPYRGCSHGCTYCLAGDTPVLLADGRTKPLGELEAGEQIYGTRQRGSQRRLVATEVLAHWSTVKPAYRVVLADGTQLIASGEHRLLTDRGWRHVTAGRCGSGRRPHLAGGDRLVGTGAFATPPKGTVEYHCGYLSGLLRADAPPGQHAEAVERAYHYLNGGISLPVEWPQTPSDEWAKGLLAGAFDAGGLRSRRAVRMGVMVADTAATISAALTRFGFAHEVEPPRRPGGPRDVRLLGDLAETIRFFHTVDPAVTSKRTVDALPVTASARSTVVAIEPLGLELPLFDITTGTGDFVANGVVSHNCFARNTHTYLDLDAGRDFDTQIVVKVNAPEVLAAQLRGPRWTREHVAMGTNTDPYQRAEGRYQLMPGIIRALADTGTPFSILTKGPVLSRDLPLLKSVSAEVSVGLGVSIALIDRELQRSVEPGTASPQARLELVRRISDAGLACGVFVAPVLPRLTDSTEQLDALLAAIVDAGAAGVTVLPLHLRPGAREWFAAWLASEHPELVADYREIYGTGSRASRRYRQWLGTRVGPLLRRHGLDRDSGQQKADGVPPQETGGWPSGSLPAGAPAGLPVRQEQLTLL